MEQLVERFLRYVKVFTTSNEESGVTPSTPGQMVFAQQLRDELIALGFDEVVLDDNGYLYATLPSNLEPSDKLIPTVGFIAHMDTAPDACGENVNPRIVEKYDGKDIVLNADKNIVMQTSTFPELLNHVGEDLIVTDGTTLLGADDKAGIAEIISAMMYLKEHPEIKHGKVRISFNPDEEIGLGAHKFNVELFGCDFAYTMDGGAVGELEFENFNAYAAVFSVSGRNIHPGSAKGMMINAALVAHEIVSMLPACDTPANTEGYEGFYHLCGVTGTVEKAELEYIIRDHDAGMMTSRIALLHHVEKVMNEKYGEGTVKLEVREQYRNMREIIEDNMFTVEYARDAIRQVGLDPISNPVRGGTDGARISFMGIPCPNLGTGGYAFHGPFEHVTVEGMDKSVEILLAIVERYTRV